MEADLALSACRVVASTSVLAQWLTLKAAISMTTLLLRCACMDGLTILNPFVSVGLAPSGEPEPDSRSPKQS